ncbi:hypothetical protein IKF12_01695 [Candidatus Saccharibacteria bacterium]|nr:hypothetical protein [Candidatus Saccharibacteria bacterium]
MKKLQKISALVVAVILSTVFCFNGAVFAEGEETDAEAAAETQSGGMSISISPVSKVLTLEADKIYEDSFKVTNNSKEPMDFEVYASPYSYTYSEADDEYKLGFSHESNYTQITRWVTFQDSAGNYVTTAKFQAPAENSVEVHYRISTPSSIPAGGQYAVLFAHTLSGSVNASGIKTEASPGLVVYGRSTGETLTAGEVSGSLINQTVDHEGEQVNMINAITKVKNTGNVDFMAQGTLKVEGVFGRTYYETPANQARISVIPETELTVYDVWEDTPYFGLFKATWTVVAAGKTEEPITKMILILPAPVLIFMILLLTIITIWIIITIRKRKERRSRFTV